MSGITGLGTTYNLPNYTGILRNLSPVDTPLFSAIGGLSSGGGQCTSTEFEWSTYDLRNPGQNVKVEGATAPTGENRVRGNVTNVVQIQQEKVSVSYSKLAAVGLKAGSNNDQAANVIGELDWQVKQMLLQMIRDVEWSFVNGIYAKPGDNSTARKTRGLLPAITTNVRDISIAVATGATIAASTDKITAAAHGFNNGDTVIFANNTAAGLSNDAYYVVNKTTNDFQVSLQFGGAAVDVTADGTADVKKGVAIKVGDIDSLAQLAYDTGGITDTEATVFMVGSGQKIATSAAFANYAGKYVEADRNVGGVSVDTIQTNFGRLGVMLDRYVPRHVTSIVSLDQCRPVYLEVPGKGHFFAEPLAKTGASDDVQLYGEVGLDYGNEKSHAKLSGCALPIPA